MSRPAHLSDSCSASVSWLGVACFSEIALSVNSLAHLVSILATFKTQEAREKAEKAKRREEKSAAEKFATHKARQVVW